MPCNRLPLHPPPPLPTAPSVPSTQCSVFHFGVTLAQQLPNPPSDATGRIYFAQFRSTDLQGFKFLWMISKFPCIYRAELIHCCGGFPGTQLAPPPQPTGLDWSCSVDNNLSSSLWARLAGQICYHIHHTVHQPPAHIQGTFCLLLHNQNESMSLLVVMTILYAHCLICFHINASDVV